MAALGLTGTALLYFTYLGGSGQDYGNGIAVDSSGNTYVTAHTQSSDFDVESLAANEHDQYDAFVTVIAFERKGREDTFECFFAKGLCNTL